jgi:hypothetical protein
MLGVSKEAWSEVHFVTNKLLEDCIFAEDVLKKGYSFKLFHSPKFKFSMRRFDDKSLAATAAEAGLIQMRMIFGKDLTEKDYQMAGGTNYKDKD